MAVGKGGVQCVGHGVGLNPSYLVDDPETEALQREAEAEDDVVRAADPERAVGLEYTPRLPQPTYVPLVVLFEPVLRANRDTTPTRLRLRVLLGDDRASEPEVIG